MKTVRFFLPVLALLTAFSAAVAFAPPMQAKWKNGTQCETGTVNTPSAGECPGGSKICQIDGHAAYSSCNFVNANLLKYETE